MAKVASSGAEDALATVDSPPRRNYKKPEAFVMSGDVLLSLNRNVSSTYAKLFVDQLPPNTEVNSSTPVQSQLPRSSASAGVAFPSMNRGSKKVSRLPVSTSQPDGVRRTQISHSESPSGIRMHKNEVAPIEAEECFDDAEEKENNEEESEQNNEKSISDEQLIVRKDEEIVKEISEMTSPNEEIVVKNMKNAIFSIPPSNAASYSSPQICDAIHPIIKESGDYDPVYDDVDSGDRRNGSNIIKCNMKSTNNASDQYMNKETPSKRSVVTIDATHSSYDPDESSNIAYYTTQNTPCRATSHLRKEIFKNQSAAGTSTSTSASPSLHAEKREMSNNSEGNLVFHKNRASTSNNTMNSIGGDREAAYLARKLFELRGCCASDVADKLNEQSEFAFLLLVKYLENFQFSTTRIDAALREFLSRVELRGESSQRERLLRVFSARYLECNPSIFDSLDDVHTLTCALLLLNSDLHGPNTGRKMTARDFITNIGHTGCTYKRDMLKTLYQSIKENAISLNHVSAKNSAENGSAASGQKEQCMYEVDPNAVVEYYSGYLVRKYVREADGAKTPFGRRSWKMVYARLRGLVLYFDTDEVPRARSRYASLENAVSLHHALAEPAGDYKKKAYVFRVRIAHGGEILFQTSNDRELNEWCEKINFVSAAFSSPTLPLPVTSKPESAPMPRLPRIPCLGPISRQIKIHEARIIELNAMIEAVAQNVYPERPKQQMLDRLVLLYFEKRRYTTYVNVLRKHNEDRKLSSGNVNVIQNPKTDLKSAVPVCEDRLSYTDAVNGI